MKTAILVIAQNGYQDVELAGTQNALLAAGFEVTIASKEEGTCAGKFGGTEEALLAMRDVDPLAYDVLAFIGGPGARALADDAEAIILAQSRVDSGKVLGAICVAPTILAAAGVLKALDRLEPDHRNVETKVLLRLGHLHDNERPARHFPRPANAAVGSLHRFHGDHGPVLVIDGRIIGRTPIADNTYLDPGVHTVAGRIGKRVVNKVFSVEKGRTADMELVLPKEVAGATAPRPPMVPVTKQSTPASTPDPGASQAPDYTLPIVVGATGAAALFTGAVMLVVASSKASRREDLLNKLPDSNPCGTGDSKPAECSEVADLASGAATFRTVAIVSFGTTLAAGVATYILWPKSRDTTSTELIFAPSYSPHRNLFQLGASGRF